MNTMRDYLYQEQELLTGLLDGYRHPAHPAFRRLFIVGCGSSFNSGKMAEPFLTDYGLSVSVYHPVEFLSTQHHLQKDDLAIFISQVGNSALVVKAQRAAKGKCITVGLTGNDDGLIAREADAHINIGCGEENWNSKTKGVSCTVLSLLLFGLHAARMQGYIDQERLAAELAEIRGIVSHLRRYTEELEAQMGRFTDLVEAHNMLWVTATAHHYAVAREFAMKVTECAYIKAAHKELEEFLHGFEMGVDGNDVFLIYALDGASRDFGAGLRRFLLGNRLTDRICVVSNRDGGDIRCSAPDSRFNIFVGLAFLQLASYRLSLKFGIDARHVRYRNINEFVKTKL